MKNLLIKRVVLPFVINFVEECLTKENVTVWLDKLFDFIEDTVKDSRTKWDDAAVLPIVKQMRKALNVPDND